MLKNLFHTIQYIIFVLVLILKLFIMIAKFKTIKRDNLNCKIAKMPKYGIFVMIYKDELREIIMLDEPEHDLNIDNIELYGVKITAPANQKFLDDVNAIFDTDFRIEHFTGR